MGGVAERPRVIQLPSRARAREKERERERKSRNGDRLARVSTASR